MGESQNVNIRVFQGICNLLSKFRLQSGHSCLPESVSHFQNEMVDKEFLKHQFQGGDSVTLHAAWFA